MKLLFVYRYCGLGGVETSIINKLDALQAHGIEARALFGEFYGSRGATLAEDSRVTVGVSANQVLTLIQSGFDAISVVDYPDFIDLLDKWEIPGQVLFETHASFLPALKNLHRKLDHVRVSSIVVPSEFNACLVKKSLKTVKNIVVIPNPVNERFRLQRTSAPPDVPLQPGGPILLWIGRLEDEKNPIEFMKIGRALLERGTDVRLLVIGDGYNLAEYEVYREKLRSEISARWSSHVIFHRAVPYHQMPGIYSIVSGSGGCLISTSLNESAPMIFIEAMGCLCPVVSSDVGGVKELVQDSVSGRLYQSGDISGAVDQLENLLDPRQSASRQALVNAARAAVAKRHAPGVVSQQYRTLIESLNVRVHSALPHTLGIRVSVVIPAFNSAGTITQAIESVLAQTSSAWELIVVDDGSTDATAEIVTSFVQRDSRIRLVQQANAGASAARNAGINQARHEWLLFLDSDDWISPLHFERLTNRLAACPELDAVYCLSARVARDGTLVAEESEPPTGDLFRILASRAAFDINACIVRATLAAAVGKFDTKLRIAEDWDFWQRIARTGANFGAVREVLSYYRMQPDSLSQDAEELLHNVLNVIRRGHSPDPRVPKPHPDHANGLQDETVQSRFFYVVCWSAGLLFGRGVDATHLLEMVRDDHYTDLHPPSLAKCIFDAAILPTCQTVRIWGTLWTHIRPLVVRFLSALEAQSRTPDLASRTLLELTSMTVKHSAIQPDRPEQRQIRGSRATRNLTSASDKNAAGEPLVSVIVPFLNAMAFLHETVESVFAQTFSNWELILVDDGSTDASSQLAIDYSKKSSGRIRYLQHEGHQNQGASASRNLGFRHARGRYISFLDSDDVLLPHKLERQVAILEAQPDAGMVYGLSQYWHSWTGNTEDLKRDHVPDLGVEMDKLYLPGQLATLLYPLGSASAPPPSDLLLRRELIEKIRGWEEEFRGMNMLYDDQAFLIKAYLHGSVYVANECWDRYRVHPDSCVSSTMQSGNYQAVRTTFLQWLDGYLTKQEINAPRVRDLLVKALRIPIVPHEITHYDGWFFRVSGTSTARLIFPADRPSIARIEIERNEAGNPFDIQLNQPRLGLHANHRYQVHFQARSERPRSIFTGVAMAHEPWTGLGMYRKCELTAEWQTFEDEFVAAADERNARIHFDLGDDDASLELAAIKLYHLPDGKPVEPSLPPLPAAVGTSANRANQEPGSDLSELRAPALGDVEFGSFRRATPISRNWGLDRGLSIDRYYIDSFFTRHADQIKGHVLEIGDNTYTQRFGGNRWVKNDVLHLTAGNPKATIVADLASAPQIPSGVFDCVILTQTLQFIYDVRSSLQTVHRILKSGGVLLATIPGVSRTHDPYWDKDWYWSFTPASARRIFQEAFPADHLEIETFGNVLTAISFLHGLSAEELTRDELDAFEPDYAVTIAVKVTKN